MAGILGNAAKLGRIKRLRDAEGGFVTWQSPREEFAFLEQQNMAKAARARKALFAEGVEDSLGKFGRAGLTALREAAGDFDAGGDTWGRFEGDVLGDMEGRDRLDGGGRGVGRGGGVDEEGMRKAFREMEGRMKAESSRMVEENKGEKEAMMQDLEAAETVQANAVKDESAPKPAPGADTNPPERTMNEAVEEESSEKVPVAEE
jgi:hypothetical protein